MKRHSKLPQTRSSISEENSVSPPKQPLTRDNCLLCSFPDASQTTVFRPLNTPQVIKSILETAYSPSAHNRTHRAVQLVQESRRLPGILEGRGAVSQGQKRHERSLWERTFGGANREGTSIDGNRTTLAVWFDEALKSLEFLVFLPILRSKFTQEKPCFTKRSKGIRIPRRLFKISSTVSPPDGGIP
jgi:hypothetical protein